MDNHCVFSARFVFVGFGSIARATLPLLLRQEHISVGDITVLAPIIEDREWFAQQGIEFVEAQLTQDNYVKTLDRYVNPGDFIVNVSVGVSSVALMHYAAHVGALYLDTCVEPWEGGYASPDMSLSQRTNYALRHSVLELREVIDKGPTAVVAHGANPGLISHLLKAGLVQLAGQLKTALPMTRKGVNWAALAMDMGVKVIHVAERDTQKTRQIKEDDEFVNTWSVDGFLSESLQPAELSWGTHEKTWPVDAQRHQFGSRNSIFLERPGASVQVYTWTPLGGPCLGRMITHHETVSTADYLTVRELGKEVYRPTVYYAYHPCDDALLSIDELIGRGWKPQTHKRIMNDEIVLGGVDALGVLLMGHDLNAYWYGSLLRIDEARAIAPFNTATSLQVAAGVLSGIVWAVRHPNEGIVEAEQMDYEEVLEIATPYLGTLTGVQTDWQPPERVLQPFCAPGKAPDPWQFEQFVSR